MSRGKYAARSALRREDDGVRSEIESYQHAVRRLTAENRELKDRLAAQESAHRQEARTLRAMLNEGLSPELSAARAVLNESRDEIRQWENAFKKMRKAYLKLNDITVGLLREEGYPAATADVAIVCAVPQSAELLRTYGTPEGMRRLPPALKDATAARWDARMAGADELTQRLEALATDTRKRAGDHSRYDRWKDPT